MGVRMFKLHHDLTKVDARFRVNGAYVMKGQIRGVIGLSAVKRL